MLKTLNPNSVRVLIRGARVPTMPDQGSPFVDLRELDAQSAYGTQPVVFYIAEKLVHRIVIGMARRVQDKAELERIARAAGFDLSTWDRDERETIGCLVNKQQIGRAEEWILSRLIKKRGVEVFRNTTGTSATPFTSISHSTKAVVVSLSDVPAGIDHEVVEPRDASWSRRMDPDGDAADFESFISAWRLTSRPEAETMLWAAKEAALKAWGIARVGLVPRVRIAGQDGHIDARMVDEAKDERSCTVLIHAQEGCVLALALNDEE